MASTVSTNIYYFLIITLIYYVTKHFFGLFKGYSSQIFFIFYVFIVLMFQYTINASISNDLCGSVQGESIAKAMLFSWIMLFIIFLLLLSIFPGWKRPFSNSFGYSLSKFSGVVTLLNKVLIPKLSSEINETNEGNSSEEIKGLSKLYMNDPSFLINEIPLDMVNDENGESIWKWWHVSDIIRDDMRKENKVRDRLFNLLCVKESVAEFIWITLIGILCCFISYNTLLASSCNYTLNELNDSYNDNMEENSEQVEDTKYVEENVTVV